MLSQVNAKAGSRPLFPLPPDAAPEKAIAGIIDLGKDLLGATTGGILFYEPQLNKLVLEYPAFDSPPELVREYQVGMNNGGNAVRVFCTGQPYLSNRARGDPNIIQKYVDLYSINQILTVPLQVGKRKIGVWHLINRSNGRWDEADLRYFGEVASRTSVCLEQNRQWKLQQGSLLPQVRLLEALMNEDSLEKALQRLGDEIKCPLVIYDQFFQPVASYTPEAADQGLLQAWEQAFRANPHLERELAEKTRSGPHCLVTKNVRGMPGSIWAVTLSKKGKVFGYLLVLEAENNPYPSIFLSEWARVFMFHLLAKQEVWDGYELVQTNFLEQLVAGTLDPERAKLKAAFLGIDLRQRWLFLLAQPEPALANQESYELFPFLKYLQGILGRELTRHGYRPWIGLLDMRMVILVQAPNRPSGLETKKLVGFINEVLQGYQDQASFYVGIGQVCAHPADYPRAYCQAQQAIQIGRQLWIAGKSVDYNQLGFYPLLWEASKNPTAESLVQRVLGPILDYDRTHKADLLRTLEVYLESGGNLKQAAQKAYSHLNTIRYRLARIEELTGKSLKDARDRFEFQLALNLLHLLGNP